MKQGNVLFNAPEDPEGVRARYRQFQEELGRELDIVVAPEVGDLSEEGSSARFALFRYCRINTPITPVDVSVSDDTLPDRADPRRHGLPRRRKRPVSPPLRAWLCR